jgi:hypothetical protein
MKHGKPNLDVLTKECTAKFLVEFTRDYANIQLITHGRFVRFYEEAWEQIQEQSAPPTGGGSPGNGNYPPSVSTNNGSSLSEGSPPGTANLTRQGLVRDTFAETDAAMTLEYWVDCVNHAPDLIWRYPNPQTRITGPQIAAYQLLEGYKAGHITRNCEDRRNTSVPPSQLTRAPPRYPHSHQPHSQQTTYGNALAGT